VETESKSRRLFRGSRRFIQFYLKSLAILFVLYISREEPNGMIVVSLLISSCCVFLIVFRDVNHLGNGDCVDTSESLKTRHCQYSIDNIPWLTFLPLIHVPSEAPAPPRPTPRVIYPPPGTEYLIDTYILYETFRKLAVQFVFDLGDFASSLVVEDVDLAVDSLLFADSLHDVTGA